MKKILLISLLLVIAGNLSAEVLRIGDFADLENWQNLNAVNEKSPVGDFCAALNPSTTAIFNYTTPKSYIGNEVPAFSDMLDEVSVEDWFDYKYVEFDIKLPIEGIFELTFTAYPLKIGRPDYMESVSTKSIVSSKGWNRIVLDLHEFDYPHHLGKFWQYIDSVSISGKFIDSSKVDEVLICQPKLKQGKVLALSCLVKSKPAKAGECVIYEFTVENQSNQVQQINLSVEDTAWEACNVKLSESNFALAKGEQKQVILTVEMSSLLVAGSREKHTVTAIANGRADLKEQIEFVSVKYLPHPYIMLDQNGWEAVGQKVAKYDWAKKAKNDYVAEANGWKVPKIRSSGYCYRLDYAKEMSRCAIAYKLTGDKKLAAKVVNFLRDFSNPQTGYLSIMRSVNGSHVHEGMFFLNLARGYDLVYDSGLLTAEDYRNLENTIRGYVHWVGRDILTGDGNNHQVSLVVGAVSCGLVMQDFDIVNRFLFGRGGYKDLMSAGILSDGNYFEGTINYNLLTANIASSMLISLEPWGLNAKDWNFEPKNSKFLMVSDWATRGGFLGMSFEKAGANSRNHRNVKDLWDAILLMCDYRGVLFASSDSIQIDLADYNNEAGFGFDTAYFLYKDESYLPVIKLNKNRNLLYGIAEVPEIDVELGTDSYYADNVGFAVLRSKTKDKGRREQIQAVQRYGSLGGYHGHFDKTALNSLSRYGRSFYNTEASWYGYWSFMFKMWVQTSSAHNMVVIDDKMQKPADNKRILFHSGELMQVSATEIETTWFDPPYGGQTPYALAMPQEKTWQECRWLPTPQIIRPQGDTGTETGKVMQRRLLVLTDDYLVVADYLSAEKEHQFDNLFHCKGLTSIDANMNREWHTAQLNTDPYSSAQFITNCNWFNTDGDVKIEFEIDYSNPDFFERHPVSLPGKLNVDYYSVWPKQADYMIGNYADTQNVARHLYYKVIADGRVVVDQRLAPWILGAGEIDIDIEGVKQLEIETNIEKAKSIKTIFLGDAYLETKAGDKNYLCDMDIKTENIATAQYGKDYNGDKVTIFGNDYAKPLAAEPSDRNKPGKITINLDGKESVRFKTVIGGDYPAKSELSQRKTVAVRTNGKEARFLSVIEPYEDRSVVKSVRATSADELEIKLVDGSKHLVTISNLSEGNNVSVVIKEYKDNELVVQETTE